MRWEGSDHGRSAGSRKRAINLPIPGRLVLGALAIAAIVLAFVSNPPQLPVDLPKAAPEAKPTAISAAIVSIPTAAPIASTAAPSAASSSAPAASSGRVHEVVAGETLSTIARKYYGDASKWSKIMDANKDTLKNPDSLQLGQKLKIPE